MTGILSAFSFLASTAGTGTGTGAPTDIWGSLLGLVIPLACIGIFGYFFLIRPQKKQDKETASMLDSLVIGDIIISTGGIVGRIIRIKDDMLLIETGGKTHIQLLRKSVREIKAKAESND